MGRDPAEIPLAIESLRLWRDLNRITGTETGFRETGVTYLCERDRDVAEYEDWLAHARKWGIASRWLSNGEIEKLLPGMARRFKGALHTETDGRAEPSLAAPAIAEAARQAGARIYTDCAVRGLETRAGRISGVVTEHGAISCQCVVVAGGAWTRLFLGNHGINFPQLKILGTVARIEADEAAEAMTAMPVGGYDFSFRKRLDGGFNVARRNVNIAPIVPDSFRLFFDFLPNLLKNVGMFRLQFDSRFFEEWRTPRRWALDAESPFERVRVNNPPPVKGLNETALANLTRAFPAFRNARITHSWAGLIDMVPDAIPVIGPIESIPGLFVASGFSGHGFGIGPGAGRLTADLVLTRPPCVDPAPFRLERLH